MQNKSKSFQLGFNLRIFRFFLLAGVLFNLLFAQQIPPQLDQLKKTLIEVDASDLLTSGEIKAKVSYTSVKIDENTTNKVSKVGFSTQILPAENASVSFYINNQPVTDKDGNPSCLKLLADKNGEVSCKALYFLNPYPKSDNDKVIRTLDFTQDIYITVKVEPSVLAPYIQTAVSEPIYLSAPKYSSSAFYVALKKEAISLFNFAACFPLFLVLGLFLAAMFYQGRSPFSLYDITVPRLPSIGNPRVKSPTIPANLAIMKKELKSHFKRLNQAFASLSKMYPNQQEFKDILNILKSKKLSLEQKFQRIQQFENFLRNFNFPLMEKNEANRMRNIILSTLDVWKALSIQLQAISNARTGKQKTLIGKTSGWVSGKLEYLATPFKFLNYLPYVERVKLAVNTMLGSREANIDVRRSLWRGIGANTLGKIPRLRPLFEDYIAESQKVANIPDIRVKLALDSLILYQAQIKNLTVLLMFSLARKISKNKEIFDNKGLNLSEEKYNRLQKIISDLMKNAKQNAENDQLVKNNPNYLSLLTDYYFALELYLYLKRTNSKIYGLDGRNISNRQLNELFSDLSQIRKQLAEVIPIKKDQSGMLIPDKDQLKNVNPEAVYKLYNQINKVGEDTSFILVGKSLFSFFEILAIRLGIINPSSDPALKLHFIRSRTEEFVALTELTNGLRDKRSYQDMRNLLTFQINSQDSIYNKLYGGTGALRNALNFTLRRQTTNYFFIPTDLNTETQKALLQRTSGYLNSLYGRDVIGVFDEFSNIHRQNLQFYHSLRSTIGFFLGSNVNWDAEGYNAWLKRGVLFEDAKKAIFINDAKMTLVPVPTGFRFDNAGNILDAYIRTHPHKNLSYLTYDLENLYPVLFGSNYAQRFVGATILYGKGNVFVPGTVFDSYVKKIQDELDRQISQFINPYPLSTLAQGGSLANQNKVQIFQNIRSLATNLSLYEKIVPSGFLINGGRELEDNSQIKISPVRNLLYFVYRFGEPIYIGAFGDMRWRLQEWYSAQAYARQVYYHATRVYEEVQQSLENKRQNLTEGLTVSESVLEDVSKVFSGVYERNYPTLPIVRYSSLFQNFAYTSGGKFNLADRFYLVAEQTVMRDPRITYGGGYGLEPAVMSTYPSGQYYNEPPILWAFFEGIPGSKLTYPLYAFSWHLGKTFAIINRPFFTLLTGYTTVYHQDPEQGYPYGFFERGTIIEAVRSFLKPSMSMRVGDIFRTFSKPVSEMLPADINRVLGGGELELYNKEGFYSVSHRSDLDMVAAGGRQRPLELTSPHESPSIVYRTDVPGKLFYSWAGIRYLYPYAAYGVAYPREGGSLALLNRYMAQTYENTTVDVYRDIYKINTSLFSHQERLNQTIQAFGLLNSPYVFPIAPLPVIAWQFIKRFRAFRNQPWNVLPPDTEPPSEVLLSRGALENAILEARQSGATTYVCPVHGIRLPVSTPCPICTFDTRTRAERISARIQNFVERKGFSLYYAFTHSFFYAPLKEGDLPPYGADKYYALKVHCPFHHIYYERGTVCPLCLKEAHARSGASEWQSIRYAVSINYQLRELNRSIERVIDTPGLSNETKIAVMRDLEQQKIDILDESRNMLDRTFLYRQMLFRLAAIRDELGYMPRSQRPNQTNSQT